MDRSSSALTCHATSSRSSTVPAGLVKQCCIECTRTIATRGYACDMCPHNNVKCGGCRFSGKECQTIPEGMITRVNALIKAYTAYARKPTNPNAKRALDKKQASHNKKLDAAMQVVAPGTEGDDCCQWGSMAQNTRDVGVMIRDLMALNLFHVNSQREEKGLPPVRVEGGKVHV
ncbi:hypothetical protein EJ06DRAFT_555205 [Trichodelitschia bisporula]|uniref:Uncharacterized protein n=1 Tax=Trichodelitschia bisporula TaxID=703511 RepID=A0A6G1I3F3_9PEZI|nr:hypothetical protein EJ06DRAFT_555205 [Trichodelitschia bisporula]